MELKQSELVRDMFDVTDSYIDKVKKSIKEHMGKSGGLRKFLQNVITDCEGHKDFKTGPQHYVILSMYLGARLFEYQKKNGYANWLEDGEISGSWGNEYRYTVIPERRRAYSLGSSPSILSGLRTNEIDTNIRPRRPNRAERRRELQDRWNLEHGITTTTVPAHENMRMVGGGGNGEAGFSTMEYGGTPVVPSNEGVEIEIPTPRAIPRRRRGTARGLEALIRSTTDMYRGEARRQVEAQQAEMQTQLANSTNNSIYGNGQPSTSTLRINRYSPLTAVGGGGETVEA